MELRNALGAFDAQLAADGRSPHTRKQYARHAGALERWLLRTDRSTNLAELDHRALAEFFGAPEARQRPDGGEKRPASVNSLRTSLRCFFAFLDTSGLLSVNPARLLRRARCSPHPPRPLQPEDEALVMGTIASCGTAVARRDHALFVVLLHTGMRIGAALQLRVEDLDFALGTAMVRKDKNAVSHEVILTPAVVRELRTFLGDRTAGPLFLGASGKPLAVRQAQRRLTYWLRQSGVARHVTLHGFRHAFGSRLLARTGNLRLVQQALGHRSIVSTTIYARLDVAEVRRAMGSE